MGVDTLLTKVRKALRKAANPAKAAAMQAYMKSAMPYHGVQTPLFRQVCREVFSDVRFDNAAQWREQVLALWRNARFREERWALRQYARTNPTEIRRYVRLYESRLSALSRREALKHLQA